MLPAPEPQTTADFFVEKLGFRLDVVTGADDPERIVVSGHGLRLSLERSAQTAPGVIRLEQDGPPAALTAPNGTRIELIPDDPSIVLVPVSASPQITHLDEASSWGTGRAGMQYRDLVPDRLGGALIASHIRIPTGGPVPDYVHHHHVRFQMIYCVRGWVEVVYEDQGPSFVLEAGDCVLQPPHVRHRVLRSSPGLEVIEVASPATHDTFVDHDLNLPTEQVRPDRDFAGQRFVRHQAAMAAPKAWQLPGSTVRDTGISAATAGWADVVVVEVAPGDAATATTCDERLTLAVVLDGSVDVRLGQQPVDTLRHGSCLVAPTGVPIRWSRLQEATRILLVRLDIAVP